MNLTLKNIMKNEFELLKVLSKHLDEQYNLLTALEKDIVQISQIAEQIDEIIKEIASLEMEKKNLLQGRSLSTIVDNCNDKEVEYIYSETLKLLDNIAVQKDTNYLFVKQQLFFTKSLIKAITPKRNAEIYDSFGKIRK